MNFDYHSQLAPWRIAEDRWVHGEHISTDLLTEVAFHIDSDDVRVRTICRYLTTLMLHPNPETLANSESGISRLLVKRNSLVLKERLKVLVARTDDASVRGALARRQTGVLGITPAAQWPKGSMVYSKTPRPVTKRNLVTQ